MKLLLLARGGFKNPKSWSGTPYILGKELQKLPEAEIETIDWQISKRVLQFYHILISKVIFNWGTSRDPLLQPLFKHKISAIIKKQNKSDWFLFISDYSLPDNTPIPFKKAVYFDSFLKDFVYYIEDKRWFKGQYMNYYEKVNKATLKKIDLIFTQNEWSRQGVISTYNISAKKVYNVGFGINVQPYFGPKDYDSELLLIVLRKGTEKYKGLHLLLEALGLIRKENPNIQLAVVGTDVGDGLPGVSCYVDQPREITVELFKKAALYVMPALHEPNGITYLEALANKAPIVGLNRFAVPEFSGYGEWGFMIEKADPAELASLIADALADKERLKDMGLKGQQFVSKRYRWDLVVGKMHRLMQEHSNI